MFKGTRTIGTKDIEADLEIIEEQEKVREEMRESCEVMRERLRRGEIDDLAQAREPDPALPRAGRSSSTSWCSSSARSSSRTRWTRSTPRTAARS